MTSQNQPTLDLNSADADALARQLQISLRLARRIVAMRPFQSVADVQKVWGIDAATYARLAARVTVSPPPAPPAAEQAQGAAEPAEPTPPPIVRPKRARPPAQREWKPLLLLLAILVCGAYFRFIGLNWDAGQHQHPDERFISMVAEHIRPVSSIIEYLEFDTQNSSLNPLQHGSYTYGMFPLFLTRYVAEWVNMTHYDKVVLVGRALSGLFDLAAVVMLYLLGARLYDRRVGLLAAALCAAAVLPIQLSHYFAVDSFSTVFVVAGFYLATVAVPLTQPPGEDDLHEGRWRHFALFGLMTGLAAACKVNTLPMFGIIIVAGLARLALHGTWRRPAERKAVLKSVLIGWLVAGVATVVAFRIFQPYAFEGPGFFNLRLNERWLAIMREVTGQVAGKSEWPPNHHWTSRPITYAGTNMVVWGLGLPLGLAAWLGWIWAAWRCCARRGDWQRHLLPVIWVAGYFLWQNAQFWRYMRYFLPIYPLIILLAAWALIEAFDRAKSSNFKKFKVELSSARLEWWARVVLVGVVALTYAYAFAFTRIYAQPHTRIAASRWIMEHVSGPLNVIVNSPEGPRSYPISVPRDHALTRERPEVSFFRPVKSGTVATITTTDIRLVAADWHLRLTADPDGKDTLAENYLIVMASDEAGDQVITFRDVNLESGRTYYLRYTIHSSGPLTATRLALQSENERDGSLPLDLSLPNQSPGSVEGTLKLTPSKSFRINRLVIKEHRVGSPSEPTTVQVKLARDESGKEVLAEALVTGNFTPGAAERESPAFSFPPVELKAKETYYVIYQVTAGGPLTLLGDAMTLETSWDDALPLRVDGYDPLGGMYAPLNLELYEPDTVAKRERMLDVLARANYIVIPSNRAYDAMPRLPLRYPMTLKYYQALFDCREPCSGDAMEAKAAQARPPLKGPLGFELVATFESYPTLGPFSFPDQLADESFTVYDHPKVMVFKKSADFSLDKVREILESADLTQIVEQAPLAVTIMPTGMRLPPDRLAAQQAGGTWYEMFDFESLLNRNQTLGAAAWYLFLLLLGGLAFPLVWAAWPGLSDRGYPLARLIALLFIAWLAWMLGSLKILPFTQATLWLSAGALVIVSGFLAVRNRNELATLIRARWRYVLGIEFLFAALFLFDLAVRLGNPDLWNPWLGGEKPMDFAFFNAVLKAVYFPPASPWFSGHYVNYYYYGYAIAAVLTKLLGIVPSIAYNLILPTWFAMTGVGAFCVTYNLVAGPISDFGYLHLRQSAAPAQVFRVSELGAENPNPQHLHCAQAQVSARFARNPKLFYLAGVLAVILMLLLGNLFQAQQLWKYLPKVTDRARENLSVLERADAVWAGVSKILAGQAELPGGKGRWYFDASRPILHDGPDTPIAEFPYFSFLYGDLHPHILAMPALFAALAWIVSVLFASGRRRWTERVAVWLMAGLVFGVFRPTHTWDFPTLLGLGSLALGWNVWRSRQTHSRDTLLVIAGYAALLVGAASAMYYPFPQWFGTEYTEFEFWQGARTPLGDYLTVHGLFLFILITFLVWETRAWLKAKRPAWLSMPFEELYERIALGIKIGMVVAVVGLVALWVAKYQVLTFGLPLLAWVVLLLVQDQPIQKRIVLGLLGAGVGLTLLVEVVVLKGDVGRSNMVFRFYTQVWALFSVAAAAALASLIPVIRQWSRRWQRAWLAALVTLVLAAASYTVTGTWAKITDRWPEVANPPHNLDGMAYMLGDARPGSATPAIYKDEGRVINLGLDYAGLRFMQDHVAGTPTIVEGHTVEYRWGSRYSIYTGLPAVIGWNWHVRQHNSLLPGSVVERRIGAVVDFYNTGDIETAVEFLRRYQVQYVIVGDLERTYYAPEGIAKFPRMVEQGKLQELFTSQAGLSQVSIYKVLR